MSFLSTFETIILPLITAAAETTLPIVLHSSSQGLAILNANEPLINATIQAIAAAGAKAQAASLQPGTPLKS